MYPPHPLWNALPIVQLASVPIREMLCLERDTIMNPPGVVHQRWIGTWKAGQGVWHGHLANSSLPYYRCAGIVLLEEKIIQTFW